jgi:hypothetical protein
MPGPRAIRCSAADAYAACASAALTEEGGAWYLGPLSELAHDIPNRSGA